MAFRNQTNRPIPKGTMTVEFDNHKHPMSYSELPNGRIQGSHGANSTGDPPQLSKGDMVQLAFAHDAAKDGQYTIENGRVDRHATVTYVFAPTK